MASLRFSPAFQAAPKPPALSGPARLPQTAGTYVGWSLLMAAYFACVGYFTAGPERVARWADRYRRRAATLGKRGLELAGNIRWRDPESMLEVHI